MVFRYTILSNSPAVVTATVLSMIVPMVSAQAAQVLRVTSDDVLVSQSCRIVIPPDTVIEDKNNNGVIQIVASDVEIEFAERAVLRGAPHGRRPDEYQGYGIRVEGQSNVTIRGARISGFWVGLWATKTDGLTLEAVDASDNRRAFLRSTPIAEDSGDWLFPHDNDNNEWLNNYGAAIYVEDANHVVVRECTVRHGQNALCIDRVNDSKIYDNDFSFNSGWGIAMWRCNRNMVSRNACDFCVRGYSHGVYNRGQDSAGILMFEQNNDNVIAENSATHSGDGFFGFAGREALGDIGDHPPQWYKRRGNNDNLLIKNDFSYAPAHGIEMTFSFGNVFCGNCLRKNAICGIWGGYSQDTLIARNHMEGNGEMAYGLERGGINIEHGRNNRILGNSFWANKCGIHLWSSPAGALADKPWAKANAVESKGNVVSGNRFAHDELAFHPYTMCLKAGNWKQEVRGTLISAMWDATFFKWTEDVDPRKDIAAWRRLAREEAAVSAMVKRLAFNYAWGGPSEQEVSRPVTAAKLGGDHFGMIATTRVPLSGGVWELVTLSDDGVRVTVDDRVVIDNWTWHGPTRDKGTLSLGTNKTVEIRVEHFEIDGYATLELKISRPSSPAP